MAKVLHQQSGRLEKAGQEVTLTKLGVSVSFEKDPPAPLDITLSATDEKPQYFTDFEKSSFLVSEPCVKLAFDASKITQDNPLIVRMFHKGDYKNYDVKTFSHIPRVTLGVGTLGDMFCNVPSSSAGENSLKGELSKHVLDFLHKKGAPGNEYILFSVNDPELMGAEEFQSEVYQYYSEPGKKGFFPASPDLTNKNVAVCVHGWNGDMPGMNGMGSFLSLAYNFDTIIRYDIIIGFGYTSNRPIEEIGQQMAEKLGPLLQSASMVDLYAHSMGNLVSRYAMETLSLGDNRLGQYLQHYVSLAGPHNGVPMLLDPGPFTSGLDACLVLALRVISHCFGVLNSAEDMITYGKPENVEKDYATTFLPKLDLINGVGPNYDSVKYYTISGDKTDMDWPWGDIINFWYHFHVSSGIVDDGLIPKYSAQSPLLERQSKTWSEGPTLPINHTQAAGCQPVYEQIQDWINEWSRF